MQVNAVTCMCLYCSVTTSIQVYFKIYKPDKMFEIYFKKPETFETV